MKLISLILVFLMCSACSKSDRFKDFIEQKQSESCAIIDIREFIGTDFDVFYIFGGVCHQDIITETTRIQYTNTEYVFDDYARLIFIKDSEVIYEFDVEISDANFFENPVEIALYSPYFKVVKESQGFRLYNIDIEN